MQSHRFNPVSFLFGILLLGAAATYTLTNRLDLAIDGRWVWPVLLVVAGVAVVAGAVRSTGNEVSGTDEAG